MNNKKEKALNNKVSECSKIGDHVLQKWFPMKVMIPPPDLWGSTGYVATTEERFKEREEMEEEWGNKEGKRNSLRSYSRQREVIIIIHEVFMNNIII